MPSVALENYNAKSWRFIDYTDPNGVVQIMIFPKGMYRIKTIGEKTIVIETYEGRRVLEFDENLMNLLGWNPTDHDQNCNTISKAIYE